MFWKVKELYEKCIHELKYDQTHFCKRNDDTIIFDFPHYKLLTLYYCSLRQIQTIQDLT